VNFLKFVAQECAMRKALDRAAFAMCLCGAFALGQTINPFAGGGLPVNITGTSASVGGLISQVGFSIGNYTGALGRGSVDSSGNLYFVAYNSVLQLSASTGVVSLIAGNGTVGFSGDNNLAPGAQLYSPFGVAIDSAGNIYISDTNNFRIRKVSTSGIITTIAGNGTKGYSGDNGPALSAQFTQPAGIRSRHHGGRRRHLPGRRRPGHQRSVESAPGTRGGHLQQRVHRRSAE
jgi:hypothetical protein